MARAAGATCTDFAGRAWIGERDYVRGQKLRPREDKERSRRLLIAAYKALERVRGRRRGLVARAKTIAREGGATFGDHAASAYLRRFKRPTADPRTKNLRQYQATRRALLLAAHAVKAA